MSVRFSATNQIDLDEDMLEEGQDESQDELPEELPRITPRPARASLTHHAIKTELMKLNKQKEQQRLTDLSPDTEEDNLSRAARKRKRRREKVLEERRASGRSEDFDEDFANFKSVSIARRRSSVLPANAVFHHYQDSSGCLSYPHQRTSCWSRLRTICWWLCMIGLVVGGTYYLWPLLNSDLNDLESKVISSNGGGGDSSSNGINELHLQPNEDQFGAASHSLDDRLAVSDANHKEETRDDGEHESSWSLFKLMAFIVNSMIPDSNSALGDDWTTKAESATNEDMVMQEAEHEQQAKKSYLDNLQQTNDRQLNIDLDSTNKQKQQSSDSNYAQEDQAEKKRVSKELDLQSVQNGQHIEILTENNKNQDNDFVENENSDWFWSSNSHDSIFDYDKDDVGYELNQNEENFIETSIHQPLNEIDREELRQQMLFDKAEAHAYVDRLVEQEQKLDLIKASRQHINPSAGEQALFECNMENEESFDFEECESLKQNKYPSDIELNGKNLNAIEYEQNAHEQMQEKNQNMNEIQETDQAVVKEDDFFFL